MDHALEDLDIVDDAIDLIRRMPSSFAGDPPSGARLAAAVMRDLINNGDLSASVERIDGWWVVVCESDWLPDEGAGTSSYWSRIVPTPDFGVNSIRSEVVLAALASGLVTACAGHIETVVATTRVPDSVRARIDGLMSRGFSGRVLAFVVD